VSDGCYSLVLIASSICYAVVLFLRWRQGRIMKRLLASLERDGKLDEVLELARKEKEKEQERESK